MLVYSDPAIHVCSGGCRNAMKQNCSADPVSSEREPIGPWKLWTGDMNLSNSRC